MAGAGRGRQREQHAYSVVDYSGQSYADIANTIKARNARITDIAVDNSAGSSFTVTYVQNTGSYGKQWWWYVGIDAAALEIREKYNLNHLPFGTEVKVIVDFQMTGYEKPEYEG